MKVVDTFYTKEFVGKSLKMAYIKALKFMFKCFFSSTIQRKRIDNVSIYQDKEYTTGGKYKIVIEIQCEVDIKEVLRKRCERCEEMHNLPWFEKNALEKCSTCKCNWLLDETQSKLMVKKSALRERVEFLDAKTSLEEELKRTIE